MPRRIRLFNDEAGAVRFAAAALEGDRPPLRRFTMTAYTGGPMQLAGWRYPVVVDLAGLRVSPKSRPILKDHDARQIVGHTDEITVADTSLDVSGVVSGTGAAAQEIIATSENGFPWQASLGAVGDKVIFVAEGKTAKANGREFAGPVYIARKSTLGEVSFVALGADDDTFAQVAAAAGIVGETEVAMDFEAWIEQHGFNPATLDEANRQSLQAVFEGRSPAGTSLPADANLGVAEFRAAMAAETQRIATIRRICGGQHAAVEAQAIAEGWDETKTELAVLRASRPAAPAIHGASGAAPQANVLEAAVCMAGKLANLEDEFDERTLDAAHSRFHGRLGLQDLLLEAAWAAGYPGHSFRSDMRGVLQAAFSTVSLPGILANTANKFLLQAFNAVESHWRAIAAIRPVNDFKQVTSHRLTGDMMYEEVGPDGELKHGKVGEEAFTNQAKTYGKLFAITRTHLINDDLGALTAVPAQLGRGAALKLNDVFWRVFLNNANFFKVENKNYAEGAGTALSVDGLTKAEQLFLDQTDADGHPLGIAPEILLVPNALYTPAQQLMNAVEIREDGNATARKYPTNNPHAGKFRVHRSSYLSNALYTGNSTKAWYLLADPANLAVIEVAFLNGQESPTVESAEADFKSLGIQFRGVFDCGAAAQSHRGGVKLKGE